MDNKTLKIGEVSKLTGLSIDAIRFYEDKEIIKPVTRTSTGYRLYDKDVIKVINFIKQAKALGFTLLEIKDFLALKIKNNSQCEIVKTKTENKIIDIEVKIKELQKMKKILLKVKGHCHSDITNEKGEKCHFLDFL